MSTVDFGPIATKIMSYNPDYVELGFVTGDAIVNLIASLKDVGYKGLVMPSTGLNVTILNNLVERVGKDYVEGWETTLFDPRGINDDPKVAGLVDAYISEYGEWRAEGCWNMGSWFFFEDAVNNTQSIDVDVLADYLHNSDHSVMTLEGYSQLVARPDKGDYRTVDSAGGHYLGVLKDGKYAPLGNISGKDQFICSLKVYGLTDAYKKYFEEYGYPEFAGDSDLDWDFLD
jgi:ABC-type branched-subunit amino acid transport system substrate-binding protein